MKSWLRAWGGGATCHTLLHLGCFDPLPKIFWHLSSPQPRIQIDTLGSDATHLQGMWSCFYCIANELPYNHDDDEFILTINAFFRQNGNINNISRLCSNFVDTSNDNEDNDGPGTFETTCNYYFSDIFNSKFESYKENNVLSMFHLKCQSLASKYMSCHDYIKSLHHKLSIYTFSETWFKQNVPSILCWDTLFYTTRLGGGVCLYIDSNLNYKERPDISFNNDDIDSLFLELQFNFHKNVIAGVIYKAPNSDGKSFNDLLDKCLSAISKENKYCYILGDFNFYILRHSSHSQTGNCLSVMYSNGLQPLITKPTRATAPSCTCTDNIFTNVLD